MYVENHRKVMKNHDLSKRESALLYSALYMYGKRGIHCIIKIFFLKKETLFSTSLPY